MDEFIRNGANQNIDPEYVKMFGGVSEDLKRIVIECQKCKLWDMAAKEAGKAGGMCEECFNKNFVPFRPIYEPNNIKKDNIDAKDGE